MAWDPDRYLQFADHRARPGYELLTRIPDVDAMTVVDLGCGTGSLTAALAERWPTARVIGIDSSPEMISQAAALHTGIEWLTADIDQWQPENPVDVIFSNAALHWLDDHQALFTRLRSYLSPGGVLAIQMPDNWRAQTHRMLVDLLVSGQWSDEARMALMRDRLSTPESYAEWVQPATVDMWRTTYFQELEGDDPVWTWVSGAILVPVLAAMDEGERDEFERQAKAAYRTAYPKGPNGTTTVAFSRLFLIAHTNSRSTPTHGPPPHSVHLPQRGGFP